ncbi:MAG: NAD(P)H-dependent oxidoreductase [Candidatus Poseidoniaceae archaeon]|jgi:NAD(P)H-dependent FMN reductase|nr:NAD(P)H-dependent oxidoreductase [Candidatus Poseidoniaceae archaeon]MDP6361665.1 NAD(P)H-dependent oxidoreductase [Candidatus Poseidoniaceae archaeon]
MVVKHITILVASSGKNVVLAEEFERCIADAGVQSTTIHLDGLELPLYTAELEKTNPDMPLFSDAALKVQHATGIIVCAPEYNGSMPPVLNNFIAWLSTSTEDFRQHFNGKPVALATHSGGGGHNLMTSMRIQFSHLGANVLGRVAIINSKRPLNLKTIEALVQGVIQ